MPHPAWSAPFDPRERKDFAVDWSRELSATNDTIASVEFTLPTIATANNMSIMSTTKDSGGMKAVMWLDSDDHDTTMEALEGMTLDVEHSIVTSAGRELSKTIRLKVRRK